MTFSKVLAVSLPLSTTISQAQGFCHVHQGNSHNPVLISSRSSDDCASRFAKYSLSIATPPPLIALFRWDLIHSYLSEFSLLVVTVSQILRRPQAKIPQIHTQLHRPLEGMETSPGDNKKDTTIGFSFFQGFGAGLLSSLLATVR